MTNQELEQLIQLYGKDIYTFCIRLTGSRQEAEDLYQDTFLTATERLYKIDSSRNPKSYLLSIALRIWKNQKRKYAWRQRIAPSESSMQEAENIASEQQSMEDCVISAEERDAVCLAVQHLPEKYRIPVILFYTGQLSVKEISMILSLPEGTVKSRLHYARNLLKKELEVLFS